MKYIYSESIHKRIREYEEGSELLGTYLQLGIIMLITIFYIVAPKGFEGREVIFQPVPYALATWIAVLLVRFLIAYSRKMRGFLVYLFIALDIGLLLSLMWSYSVQYQTGIALSLKAPTFIFLIFFIFVRSLRFQIRYIIVGWALSVLGWLTLVFFAYREGPVTHDFFEYATSNVLLFGAEIEKLLGITVCTVVICLAAHRSKQILVFSHQQRDVMQNLSLFFSQNVVKRIASQGETINPGKGEERTGVIMSVDIRGFTVFSAQHSVAAVMHTLSEYQAIVLSIVQKNLGSIDKFMGDGILIHFGVADDSPQYAAHAIRTAEEIISAIRKWNKNRVSDGLERIEIGIGMDVGRVVFGTVGNESRLEFTVIGDPVNTSAKLEKATKIYPGHIMATKKCYTAAREQGYAPHYTPFLIREQKIGESEELVDIVVFLTERQAKEAQQKERISQ